MAQSRQLELRALDYATPLSTFCSQVGTLRPRAVKSLGQGLWTQSEAFGLPAGVSPFSPQPLLRSELWASKLGHRLIYAPLCQALAWAAGAKWDTAVAGRRVGKRGGRLPRQWGTQCDT